MNRKWIALIVALGLLAVMLSGCSFKNKVLDAQMEMALAALNDGNSEKMYQLIYPGAMEERAFDEGFDQIMQAWQEKQPEDLKLVRFYVNSKVQADFRQKTYEGIYKMTLGDESCYIYLLYADTSEGSGIVNLNLLSEDEVSGVEISAFSIVSLVFEVLFWLIVVFTIIDIIRKKPRRYGWYIVLALLRVTLRTGELALIVPVGVIIYWGIRRNLLRKKAEWLEAQNPSVDEPEVADEDQPEEDGEDQE